MPAVGRSPQVRERPGTVVDSSVLLDVFTEDERWLAWSEAALVEALARGPLILNAVVLAEIAVAVMM